MLLATFLILSVANRGFAAERHITQDTNLNSWFESAESAATLAGALETASAKLTINVAKVDIIFPVLREVRHLDIISIYEGAKQLRLPALTKADSITIRKTELETIHFPKLEEVGDLTIEEENLGAKQLEFPGLVTAGYITIKSHQLGAVHFPKLETVKRLVIEYIAPRTEHLQLPPPDPADSFIIINSHLLKAIDLSSLKHIENLTILFMNQAIKELDFSGLITAGYIKIPNVYQLETIRLPKMEKVKRLVIEYVDFGSEQLQLPPPDPADSFIIIKSSLLKVIDLSGLKHIEKLTVSELNEDAKELDFSGLVTAGYITIKSHKLEAVHFPKLEKVKRLVIEYVDNGGQPLQLPPPDPADSFIVIKSSQLKAIDLSGLKQIENLTVIELNQDAKELDFSGLVTAGYITIKSHQLEAVHFPKLEKVKRLIIENTLKGGQQLQLPPPDPADSFIIIKSSLLKVIDLSGLKQIENLTVVELNEGAKELDFSGLVTAGYITIKSHQLEAVHFTKLEKVKRLIIENILKDGQPLELPPPKPADSYIIIKSPQLKTVILSSLREIEWLEIMEMNQGAKQFKLPALLQAKFLNFTRTPLESIHLPLLERISKLYIIENSALQVIDIEFVEHVDEFLYRGNKIVPFGKFKWFYHGDLLKMGNKSHVECHMSTEFVLSGDDLQPCTHIYGNLSIRGLKFETDDLKIKEIHGCITVENTNVDSLEFLRDTKITECIGGHRLDDNRNLCPIYHGNSMFLKLNESGGLTADNPITTAECYVAACPTGLELGCKEFYGRLVIDDSNADKFTKLEKIYGGLQITTIRHHDTVDLGELTTVISLTKPVIRVNRNIKLKRLRVPKLSNFTAINDDGTGSLILIAENTQDLESSDGRKCAEYIDRCTVIAPPPPEKPWNLWTHIQPNFWIVVGVWLGLIVLLFLVAQAWLLLIWIDERDYWQGIEKKRMREKQVAHKHYRRKRDEQRWEYWKNKAEEDKKKAISNWQTNNQVKHIKL